MCTVCLNRATYESQKYKDPREITKQTKIRYEHYMKRCQRKQQAQEKHNQHVQVRVTAADVNKTATEKGKEDAITSLKKEGFEDYYERRWKELASMYHTHYHLGGNVSKEDDPYSKDCMIKLATQRLLDQREWHSLSVSENERRPVGNPRQYSVYEQYEQRVFDVQPKSNAIKSAYRVGDDGLFEVVDSQDHNVLIAYELERLFGIDNYRSNRHE